MVDGSCIQFPGLIFHVENSAAYREDPGNGPSESLSGTPFVPGMLTWKQSKVWGRARYARWQATKRNPKPPIVRLACYTWGRFSKSAESSPQRSLIYKTVTFPAIVVAFVSDVPRGQRDQPSSYFRHLNFWTVWRPPTPCGMRGQLTRQMCSAPNMQLCGEFCLSQATMEWRRRSHKIAFGAR